MPARATNGLLSFLSGGYAAGSRRGRGASSSRPLAAVCARHLGGVIGRRPVARAAGVVVRLEYGPRGGGRGHLATRLEGSSALDHHEDHQGIVLVLGPSDEVVYRVPVLPHLAGPRLADYRQGHTPESILGGSAATGNPPQAVERRVQRPLRDAERASVLRGEVLRQIPVLFAEVLGNVRRHQGTTVSYGREAPDEL